MFLHYFSFRKVTYWRQYPFFTVLFEYLPFFSLLIWNVMIGLFVKNRLLFSILTNYSCCNPIFVCHFEISLFQNYIDSIFCKEFIFLIHIKSWVKGLRISLQVNRFYFFLFTQAIVCFFQDSFNLHWFRCLKFIKVKPSKLDMITF